MYADFSRGEKRTKGQVMMLYKNTLYTLERERAVLMCMVRQYMKKGTENLGEMPCVISQNHKVDNILVQEMHYRELLMSMPGKEA
jgi:hypothetical protein